MLYTIAKGAALTFDLTACIPVRHASPSNRSVRMIASAPLNTNSHHGAWNMLRGRIIHSFIYILLYVCHLALVNKTKTAADCPLQHLQPNT